jgi:hypothetical protein
MIRGGGRGDEEEQLATHWTMMRLANALKRRTE